MNKQIQMVLVLGGAAIVGEICYRMSIRKIKRDMLDTMKNAFKDAYIEQLKLEIVSLKEKA
jgi:hypothetical protein